MAGHLKSVGITWEIVMVEKMAEMMSNQWIVGIGSGLIVSLIIASVALIAKRINNKKTLNEAHEKCIAIILEYIDKKGIPDETIVLAIVNVVARKYLINPQKINVKIIFEELLVQLAISKKYSSRKTKDLLTNLEKNISKLDIRHIDIVNVLGKNQELGDIVNDILVYTNVKYDTVHMFISVVVATFSYVPLYIVERSFIAGISYFIVTISSAAIIWRIIHKQ